MRTAEITRETSETDIFVRLELEGKGESNIDTGCGFLDHMLELFARHGRFNLTVTCHGDIHVDYHHTVEDVGICLGQAFAKTLGDKKGIRRYADTILPMDEALVLSAVDISGRGGCYYDMELPTERVGDFDTELDEEFWIAFARHAGITLHLRKLAGRNTHHILEAGFKSMARSLKVAVSIDPDYADEIPSTKGTL